LRIKKIYDNFTFIIDITLGKERHILALPPHLALYTSKCDSGIGVDSYQELEELTHRIEDLDKQAFSQLKSGLDEVFG
jgi:hypothetical protein